MPNQQDNSRAVSQVFFSWKCPEYAKYKKNALWYMASFVAVIMGVAWAIYTVNYLFAVFLVLFYLVVIMHEFRNPREIECMLTAEGIKHADQFFFYNKIEDFFIIYQDEGIKNLYIDFKNPLRGRLIIDLTGQDAVSIREFLLQFLKEDLEREVEPISERFRRLLKL